MTGDAVVHFSTGNLWADIGRPDADEALVRAKLLSDAADLVHERNLSASGAAETLGIDEACAADVVRGKLSRFSLERLIAFLNALGRDVEITVRRRPAGATGAARFVVTGD